MKTCSKCLIEKPMNEFYQQNDRKNSTTYCKSCFNSYCMKRWQNKKVEAIKYKGSKCIDCGLQNAPNIVYDFHHLDPSKKDYDWTKLRLRSTKDINTELDKCVLLCSNCHRIRHYTDLK